jgi:hypothetical protein
MKKKLRTLRMGDDEYLWRCTQAFEETEEAADPYSAVTTLAVYSGQAERCKLVVNFHGPVDAMTGNPLFTGEPLRLGSKESVRMNLNRPGHVQQVLEYVLALGIWDARADGKTVTVENGVELLEQLEVSAITGPR